ncbi:hypothetical protein A225_3889 [Klebsiella michiganensis E718]|nr:hypothetical protein A225_3889 [Klebsiella michiganensis E718]
MKRISNPALLHHNSIIFLYIDGIQKPVKFSKQKEFFVYKKIT